MIWAILVALGVPLWLCAVGIFTVILQNRKLRRRDGDIPVRVRRHGNKRWTRGHAIWVSDVFAWRGIPAAWDEDLSQVSGATLRAANPEERKKLHRLGQDPAIATLALTEGDTLEVAAARDRRSARPVRAAPGEVAEASPSRSCPSDGA